ncbi:MAG: HAD-IA family hydrolase [Nitriliruptorales bacterium]|nr:HAD-IA family hydrolase [Nitriliruptorales bacterium]
MLRALCLDLMGTVLHDPYLEALQAATGLDVVTAHQFKDPASWPAFEIAAIDEAEFARRFFADPDGERVFDLNAFHRVRRSGYCYLPGMCELLDALGGHVERYVASNYPIWIEELRAAFGLDERFEGVWASHHLGVRKPDPRFFERFLSAIGHEPQHCLFVDDREDNCEAAQAVGMRAHRFVDAEGLAGRLREEGIPVEVGPAGN